MTDPQRSTAVRAYYRYIVVVGLDDEGLAFAAAHATGVRASGLVEKVDAIGVAIAAAVHATLPGQLFVEVERVDALEPLGKKDDSGAQAHPLDGFGS